MKGHCASIRGNSRFTVKNIYYIIKKAIGIEPRPNEREAFL